MTIKGDLGRNKPSHCNVVIWLTCSLVLIFWAERKKKIYLPSSQSTSIILHYITWHAVPSLHSVKRLLSLNFKVTGLSVQYLRNTLRLESGSVGYCQFCPKVIPWVLLYFRWPSLEECQQSCWVWNLDTGVPLGSEKSSHIHCHSLVWPRLKKRSYQHPANIYLFLFGNSIVLYEHKSIQGESFHTRNEDACSLRSREIFNFPYHFFHISPFDLL